MLRRSKRSRRKQEERLFKSRGLFDNLTWTCHICKDERPDAKISVWSKKRRLEGDVVITENIRYCNDRDSCIEGARTYTIINLGEEIE